MSDIGALIAACIASGIVLSSLCAMVVVPLALWLAIRQLSPAIVSMHGDPFWQAPAAALAAALPGLAFGSFATEAILTGAKSKCLMYVSGRVLFGAVIALAICAFVRASLRAARQHSQVRLLVAESSLPSPRLARIGAELGLSVRSVRTDSPVCALAGVLRPMAFVSLISETKLNDLELRAALLHERAHRNRRDQLIIAILAFVTDLLPLPVGSLVTAYRRARELCADREAIRHSGRLDLAGAIITMAGASSMPLATALSGEPDITHLRLDTLLNDRVFEKRNAQRVAVAGALAALTMLTSAVLVASLVISADCARLVPM